MPTPLLLMIAVALAYFAFTSARDAAELAARIGRDACRAAGVQWLDQAAHATGLRLRRHANGWLGLERSFRFEYSRDGIDRQIGRLVLRGDRLVSFVGPVKPAVTPINLH